MITSAKSVDERNSFRFAKALFAFLALPGMIAFVIPLWLAPDRTSSSAAGLVFLVAGAAMLLLCVREFYVAGKGTLAPWSPPKHLVVTGLYRWSRNPMYVAVTTILLGWTLWFQSSALLLYAGLMVMIFIIRVIAFEEPWLARTHGEQWTQYKSRVRRWI